MNNLSYLLVDSGNTRLKWTIHSLNTGNFKVQEGIDTLIPYLKENAIAFAFFADVAGRSDSLKSIFQQHKISNRRCNYEIKLPFGLKYKTPQTLGDDRIALVAGAMSYLKSNEIKTTLIIDLGTCITYDLLLNGNFYLGGAISPGLRMRYKAMHQFTSSLPELEPLNDFQEIGESTASSLISGVNNGILGELNYFIAQLENKYGPINVILSGGDKYIFESKVKHNIFATENLILEGLKSILKYNEFFQ